MTLSHPGATLGHHHEETGESMEETSSPDGHYPTRTPTGEDVTVDVASQQEGEGESCCSEPTALPSRRPGGGDVRSLLQFVSLAGGDIKAALDKSAPCKRSVDHRKYLQKQLCRISAAPPPSCPAAPHCPSAATSHLQQHSPNCAHLHAQKHYHCPADSDGGIRAGGPNSSSSPPSLPATLHAPSSSSSRAATAAPHRGGGAHSADEEPTGRSGVELLSQGADNRWAPHDATPAQTPPPPPSCSQRSSPPPPSSLGVRVTSELQQSPDHHNHHHQEVPDHQEKLPSSPTPQAGCTTAVGHAQLPSRPHSPECQSPQARRQRGQYGGVFSVGHYIDGSVIGQQPSPLSDDPSAQCSIHVLHPEGVATREQFGVDFAGVGVVEGSCSPTGEGLFLQSLSIQPEDAVLSVLPAAAPGAWRSVSSPAAGQCMASPPADDPLPPAFVIESPSSSSSTPPSSPQTPPAAATMVVATSGPETAADKLKQENAALSTPARALMPLPPDVAEDRDPLFEVPGVVNPTRGRGCGDAKEGGVSGKASIPLRQRQLPASFWKEPRPDERRAQRELPAPSPAADLLTAHAAFFVPYPGLQGCKSNVYENYKAMADLYHPRYQGLVGEVAAAHRSAAVGGAGSRVGPAGLTHPEYILSAYGSKLPAMSGVNMNDPTALSVVATAAAYHPAGGLYPWGAYNLLPGEAEKALVARLQGGLQGDGGGHHPAVYQHQHPHPHLLGHAPATSHPTPTSASPHHVVNGHTLLYHHSASSRQSAMSTTAPPSSTVLAASTSRAAVHHHHHHQHGSPPGSHTLPGSGPPGPGALWDPLAALSAQTLLRQPPTASLWRPIPTKTLSAYQSRFHPFADVH